MKYRYERKYLVNNKDMLSLRDRLSSFVRPDVFANKNKEGHPEYTVRSIYFDSPTLTSLLDKNEGIRERKKLRIRGYDQQTENSKVFLEIKRKLGNRILKNRSLIPFSCLDEILEFGLDEHMEEIFKTSKHKEDAIRFLYQKSKQHQTPVNLIVYDREPYHGKFNGDVRITFDKNIRSRLNPSLQDLFSNVDLSYVWEEHFILEIKYYEPPMPLWAKSIVSDFKLQSEALSKYVEGYYCKNLKTQ